MHINWRYRERLEVARDRIIRASLLLDPAGAETNEVLVTRGDRIVDRGPAAEILSRYPSGEVSDFTDCALLPGTVNAHSHSFQSLLVGCGVDQPFVAWRAELYARAPRFDPETVYVAAALAFGEMLLQGVTCVVDFFYLNHGNNERALAVAKAAQDVGIRLVLARVFYDSDTAPAAFRETPSVAAANTRALAARLQGSELVTVIPAPHSPHAASSEMLHAAVALAREWGTPWHMHLAESSYEADFTLATYGLRPLEWMRSLGALDGRACFVHGVWLDPGEIEIAAEAGAALIHCPSSNLFLGDGVCPLQAYRAARMPIALGCDSASAQGHLSVFEEMRMAALVQKGAAQRPDALDAASVLAMGTLGGARVTGLPIGSLEVGGLADLVAIDLRDLSLRPRQAVLDAVVYRMRQSAVRHVIVGGQDVVRDHRLVGRDEEWIAQQLEKIRPSWETAAR